MNRWAGACAPRRKSAASLIIAQPPTSRRGMSLRRRCPSVKGDGADILRFYWFEWSPFTRFSAMLDANIAR
jgi:hypothetical protein